MPLASFNLGVKKETSTTPSEFDLEMAKLFIKEFKKQRLLDKIPLASNWANEFRLLRRIHTQKEIEDTLVWYCSHHREEYVPKTLNAEGFRSKFVQIRDAMMRGTKNWNELPDVEISEDAKEISLRLGDLIWPGDEKKDELKAIQISLNNYKTFMAAMRKAVKENHKYTAIAERITVVSAFPKEFVEGWMDEVHRMSKSPNWAGNLARHVVSVESERFRRIVNQWIIEYKGVGDWWRFVEEILNG